MTSLRDYQRAAIDSIYGWFETSSGNPLVVVPTGGGKSVIAAEFIREVMVEAPGERILVVTHVKELVAQNHAALLRSWPEGFLRCGINSAGLRRRDTRSSVLFASVQSVYSKAEQLGHFDLVLVDEAHLIPPKGFGMYQQLLTNLRKINPAVKLIGLTATPYRTDTGSLDAGDDKLFHGVAYECDIVQLIKDGWLSNVTNQGASVEIDTSQVHIRGGEFVASELQEAAVVGDLVATSIKEVVARSTGRKSWLLFCCGIDHAKQVATALSSHGVSNAMVFGDTADSERDRVIADFRGGKIRAVVNVGVLTTGFDAPNVDLIVMMRPTESPGLYVQMVGRGLRRAEGKTNCLVLDFAGNVMRHGSIDRVRPKQPGQKNADYQPPMKKCEECGLIVHVAVAICPQCQAEFPTTRGKANHDERPDEGSQLIAGLQPTIQRWPCSRMITAATEKAGKPTTLRVTYLCGFKRDVNEWICFEHPVGSFAQKKAARWWKEMGGKEPIPSSVDLARVRIEIGELLPVVHVTVDTSKEWPEIKGKLLGTRDGNDDPAPLSVTQQELDELPF